MYCNATGVCAHEIISKLNLHCHYTQCFPRREQGAYELLGMRTRIFASHSQCINTPTEAARARALLTAREARLPTNLRARRKLDFLRMTEVTFLSVTN